MFLAADNDKMIDKMAAMAHILRDLLGSVVNFKGRVDLRLLFVFLNF